MNTLLNLIFTFGIVLIPSFVLARLIISPKINRKTYSMISALIIGLILFLLAILYVRFHPIIIGLILFILAIPGTFPTSYFLYPRLKSRIEAQRKPSLKNRE
jgi:hypothetical protein